MLLSLLDEAKSSRTIPCNTPQHRKNEAGDHEKAVFECGVGCGVGGATPTLHRSDPTDPTDAAATPQPTPQQKTAVTVSKTGFCGVGGVCGVKSTSSPIGPPPTDDADEEWGEI